MNLVAASDQNMAQYKKETLLGQIKPVRLLEISMELDFADLSKMPGSPSAQTHHGIATTHYSLYTVSSF